MSQSKRKLSRGSRDMGLKIHPFSKETKDVTVSVRLTKEAKEVLEALADSVGITYNRYVAKLIEVHLEELEAEGKLPKPKNDNPKKNGR